MKKIRKKILVRKKNKKFFIVLLGTSLESLRDLIRPTFIETEVSFLKYIFSKTDFHRTGLIQYNTRFSRIHQSSKKGDVPHDGRPIVGHLFSDIFSQSHFRILSN